MGETIDSTAVEVDERADAVPEPHALVPTGTALAVTPQVQAVELIARLDVIREAQQKAMVAGVDYGVIPGTDKPTLLKPGAEKLGVLFQLDVQLVNEKTWGPGDHLTVESRATVFHAPSGARLGYGEGVCTTRERKYAKRKQERVCPSCGKPAVIKGREEYGGGWLCFGKKGGCGAKWPDDAPEIESQQTGEVENPDLPDLWNTVTKMAEKRARVDAVLAVTGASALFTQDVEDMGGDQSDPAEERKPQGFNSSASSSPDRPSAAQLGFLEKIVKGQAHGIQAPSRAQLTFLLDEMGGPVLDAGWMDKLTKGQCSALISRIKEGPLPVVSEVPPVDEPTHAPVGDDSDVPFSERAAA